jgi:phosphoribosyl 1,2-cyclic phosphodiesterase
MQGFCPLASGSKGNCIYVGTSQTKILIDGGISVKMAKERLAQLNVDLGEIEAILVTHEHTDHIQGLKGLACKLGIPILANSETAKGIVDYLKEYPKFKIFSTGDTFQFGDMEIHPFSIQHDTLDPVGFTIHIDSLKLGFCADLGFPTTLVQNQLKNCDYLYLEANHQPSMVHACARPMVYKQRVLSRVGHLSNESCGKLLREILHPGLKHVHLAHLSSECNNPETALRVVNEFLEDKKMALGMHIAWQHQISDPIYF